MLGVIGVLIAIALVIILAYKGWGIIPASLICSLIVIVTNGGDIWTALSQNYAAGFKYFAGTFFLIFVLGSLFGKVMGDSGCVSAISYKILDVFGPSKANLVLILACALLTYGGVNLFIVIFTLYPISLILFKAADSPKRIIVACATLGSATFTMTAIPGTPAIQNLIPSQVLGTSPAAAPLIGIVGAVIMFGLGYWYVQRESRIARANGEHFVAGPRDNMENLAFADTSLLPDWKLSLLPIVVVIGLILVLRNKVDPMYTVSIAMVSGIVLAFLLNWKRFDSPLKTINEGVSISVMPLINTAAIVAFGFVVQNVPAFQSFVSFALGMHFHPLVSAAVAVNIVAGITGSASGGLSIFMKTMAPEYIKMGVDPAVLHRVCAIASGGLDSLPHSGAAITTLAVMGLTHKEGYKGMCVTTVIIPIIATIVCVILGIVLY